MMHHIGPEFPFFEPYWRSMYEVRQGMTEKERQEFQTKVMFTYFQQINGGREVAFDGVNKVSEEQLLGELQQGLLHGLLRVKWLKEAGEPHIAIADDDRVHFVEAVIPQELFDLFAPDCRYYREMTNTLFEEVGEWAAGCLGRLLGLEDGNTTVSKMSREQQMFVNGAVRELMKQFFEKHRELLAHLRS